MGDAVFGVAPGCLGEAVVGPAQLLAPLPPSVSFANAATIPTTYATVLAAFNGSTALRKGCTVRAACIKTWMHHCPILRSMLNNILNVSRLVSAPVTESDRAKRVCLLLFTCFYALTASNSL